MNIDNIYQMSYLLIGFAFGVLTSVIRINFESKTRNLELIREWLSDIEEEFTITVDFQKNFARASYIWGDQMHKDTSIKLMRSNARMIGLIRSKATTKAIRDATETVLSKKSLGQNILNQIRMENSKDDELNHGQIESLDYHLSLLTESVEFANKIIAEHESNPLRMLFS